MHSCTFFGHRNFDYSEYDKQIEYIISDLIMHQQVSTFYNGFRGNFDRLCACAVHNLKQNFPQIKNILVLSYHPTKKDELPKYFEESVYLIERSVPQRFAIVETNKLIADAVDFIISGVKFDFGGACSARDYAQKRGKTIIELFNKIGDAKYDKI